jgi:hypothetical protein
METNLADHLTIDPNALSIINATSDIYTGPFHKIEKKHDSSSSLSFPSVSDVINESRQYTGVSVTDDDQRQALDAAWRAQMRHLFRSAGKETFQEWLNFEETGKSNGYTLGLQVMVLSPGKCFKIHAHPNIEFEYTMLGTLREFRSCHFKANASDLTATSVPAGRDDDNDNDDDGGNNKNTRPPPPPPPPPLLQGPDIAASYMFEERSCPQNHCMLNETGSVHQSFTSPHEGCAILVLWSQCHANTHPSRVFTTDARLRPLYRRDLFQRKINKCKTLCFGSK